MLPTLFVGVEIKMGPTIKSKAVNWLVTKHGVKSKSVYASKFYVPESSRTRQSAWWLEIPQAAIEMAKSAEIHLVCEVAPDIEDFHYLKVPVEFFRKNLPNFDIRKDGRLSLFLSAEPEDMFVDRRGRGKVSFSDFLIS
jgi:hypothetical protein